MTISLEVRQQVRQRAGFACEFCSVSELDSGGLLTIDHFQPRSKGGGDEITNLVYACVRCNQFKQDYWPADATEPRLWNPRDNNYSDHFLPTEDGKILALTLLGQFTIQRLRLNRPLLVNYRLNKQSQHKERQLLLRYRDLVDLLSLLNEQFEFLVLEQQQLLEQQRDLLRLILNQDNPDDERE